MEGEIIMVTRKTYIMLGCCFALSLSQTIFASCKSDASSIATSINQNQSVKTRYCHFQNNQGITKISVNSAQQSGDTCSAPCGVSVYYSATCRWDLGNWGKTLTC